MKRKIVGLGLLLMPLAVGMSAIPSFASSIVFEQITLPGDPATPVTVTPSGSNFIYTYDVDLTFNNTLSNNGIDGFTNMDSLAGLVANSATFSPIATGASFALTDGTPNGPIMGMYNGANLSAPGGIDLVVGTLSFTSTLPFNGNGVINYMSHDSGETAGDKESFVYTTPSAGSGSTPLPAAFGPGVLVLGAAAFFGKRRMSKAAV
jgi:hypothetical protein